MQNEFDDMDRIRGEYEMEIVFFRVEMEMKSFDLFNSLSFLDFFEM